VTVRRAITALLATLVPLWAQALQPAEPRCQSVLNMLQSGQAITAADLGPADCDAGLVQGALRYDARLHLTRARIALAPGDVVPEVAPVTLARWRIGDAVHVVRHAGPVRVERAARIAMPAPRCAMLTLRTSGGVVLAASEEQIREVQP
jgi:hypothetical protein